MMPRRVAQKHDRCHDCINYTLKKKVLYGTLKKGSVDVEKLPSLSKVSKKNKNFYETLKGSSPCHTGRTFFLRNLFQFREAKKRFRRKVRNL